MKPVKTTKHEGVNMHSWSDFFTDHILTNRWPFHGMDLYPAVNIKEDDKAYHTEIAVPGFTKKDFNITVEGSYLTISADKETDKNESDEHYFRREFQRKSFSRSFNLPPNADEDHMEAVYQGGMLQLTIPKKEKSQPTLRKKIKVS